MAAEGDWWLRSFRQMCHKVLTLLIVPEDVVTTRTIDNSTDSTARLTQDGDTCPHLASDDHNWDPEF